MSRNVIASLVDKNTHQPIATKVTHFEKEQDAIEMVVRLSGREVNGAYFLVFVEPIVIDDWHSK